MSLALLTVSVAALGLGILAVRSRRLRGPWWVLAMAAAEVATWFLVASAMVAAGHVAAWDGGPAHGLGLAAAGTAAVLFGISLVRTRSARGPIEAGAADLVGTPVTLPRIRRRRLLRPYPPLPGNFEVETFTYGPHPRHRVDRVARAGVRSGPVLVHVHGGGWWRGRRARQARPLIHRMASRGWVVLVPSYRVSPEATFPDHLDDVERVLAWARSHAADLGADTRFVAVAGGSAGGQLAALAGLRDPSLGLVIPIYGVHDLLAADGMSAKWRYLETDVMKSSPAVDPEAWAAASPIRSATADRAPFLIVHGSADWVVGAGESRRLVAALRAVGGPPVGHIEIPYANHGFDFFSSPRSLLLAEGIAAALEAMCAAQIGARGGEPED